MNVPQSPTTPEQQNVRPEAGLVDAAKLEVQSTPSSAEDTNTGVKDDGVASAQQTVASVAAADPTGGQSANPPSTSPPPVSKAGDQDVIEPEWVGKAQAIVEQHRQDPHQEEAAVEDLQRDYLKQRYGMDVKSGDQ